MVSALVEFSLKGKTIHSKLPILLQWNLISGTSLISNNSLLNLTTLPHRYQSDQLRISQVTEKNVRI